jgi:restriction endonuclease S subunit
MAVWNEINLSYMARFNRSDAEFFKPDYEAAFEKVIGCAGERLRFKSFITDGIHASPDIANGIESGIRYISAKCVKDNEFNVENCIFISNKQHIGNPRTQLRLNDVIITTVGTIGNAAVVDDELIPSNSDRHVGIVRINDPNTLSPFYLATFLNSKYGRFQSLREAAGNVQLNLYIKNIGNIVVPRFEGHEIRISKLTEDAYTLRRTAKELYTQAQQLLESELGLDKLRFDKPMGYTARFSELELSHRTDAQHYQPRFAQLLEHLAKFPTKRIRESRRYNRRGIQPVYADDATHAVVNSQHLGPKHINYEGLQKTTEHIFNASPEAHIQPEDLLIYTTGAYIGRTNVYLDEAPAFASNHVNILRLSPEIDHAYMAMVFQSIIGQFQTLKHSRGSAQAELYPADIDKFMVPLLPPDQQQEIGNLVRESLTKQRESAQLLNQVKSRVEQLIEEAVRA